MKSLTVVTAGTAIVSPTDARKTIIANLTALELAFADGRKLDQAQSDMRIALWQEALDGTPFPIAIFVSRRIRLFNPRNPFAPTPQDVFEFAQATVRELHDAVEIWAIEGRWSPGRGSSPLKGALPDGWFPKTLAAPFEPGCIVEDDEVTGIVSRAVVKKSSRLRKLLAPTATRYEWEVVARLEIPPWRAILARLTDRAINSETTAIISALDNEHTKRRAEQFAHEADLKERRRAASIRELALFDADMKSRAEKGNSLPPHTIALERAAIVFQIEGGLDE